MQITIGSPELGQIVGVSNPWTEYVKILPSLIPLPTMWTEEERVMLVGTSLEVIILLSSVVWSRSSFSNSTLLQKYDGVPIPSVGELVLPD